ncbi:MAG: InlB B-repeat-containing protein [Oscillospiraceae bacterium]|nr:InlB B-repeat-containing protein [Oscillospiraceae bacterium]
MSKNKRLRKTMAVFMAVLMVMSCWVFTPIGLKASAIDSGEYYVRITWQVSNEGGSMPNAYKGESSITIANNADKNNCAGISLFYKDKNGTGTTGEVYWNIGQSAKTAGQAQGSGATVTAPSQYIDDVENTDYYLTAKLPGFPTQISAFVDYNKATYAGFRVTRLEVGSSTSNYKTLWSGEIKVESQTKLYGIQLKSDYTYTTTKGTSFPSLGTADCSTSTKSWEYPKADTITWTTSNTSDVITPEDSSAEERYVTSYCKDQYGVRLACNPTYSFKCTGDTTSTTGITAAQTDSTANSTYKFTINNAALLSTKRQNTRKVSVTAKYTFNGVSKTDSTTKYFNVTDPKHTITFDGNGGTVSPLSKSVYYGESLNSQKTYDNNTTTSYYPTSGKRDGYTWIGMFDGTGTGAALMDPDAVLNADKTYYAHWEKNKYVAVFWDRRNANVVHVESDIAYEDDITAAGETAKSKLPQNEYDEAYHYTFKEWDTDLTSVTENLPNISPVYTAEAHTFDAGTTVAATCQHGAGTEYKCTGCDYSYVVETSSETAPHQFSDAVTITKEPTCTEAGEGYKTCTVCGAHSDTVSVPATGHSYKVEKTDATCTATGSIKYTCTKCGETHTDTLPMIQHDMQAGTKVAATCTSAAYTPYTCKNCSHSYNVYDDTQPAIGHSWGAWTVTKEATNTANGTLSRTCSKCGATETATIPKGGHTFSTTPTEETPATCHSTGTQTFKCTAHTDCGVEITVTTAKIAHNFKTTVNSATCTSAGSVVTKCQNSGCSETITTAIAALGHNYDTSTVTKEATCTATGTRTYTCSRCSAKKTETIAALGHKTVTIPATCTQDGKTVCALCGTITATTTATGHTYGAGQTLIKATCVNQGVITQTCSVCGHTKNTLTAKTDHSWNADKTVDWDSTCSSFGQQSTHCSVCGTIKDGSAEQIAKKAHTWGEEETVVAATCTGSGTKKKVCSVCEKAEITVINPLGHNYQTTSETAATCTEAGVKEETCLRCSDINRTVTQPTGHVYVKTPVAATCGKAGYYQVTCQNCSDVSYKEYSDDLQATGNHSWNITSTVDHGTATVSGTCTVCGATFTKTVNSDHDFTGIKSQTPATCKSTGTLVLKCAVDGCTQEHTITLPINSNAHSAVTTTVTHASCETAGSAVTKCNDCGKTLSTATIPASGHAYNTQTEYVAPTCKAAGHVTYQCAKCSATKTDTIPADENAHKFAQGDHHDATCTTPAYDEYSCEYCGKTYKDFTGNPTAHNWTYSHSQSGTTLTVTCKCSSCGAEHSQTIEVAEGHNYSNVEVIKEATCAQGGKIRISCDGAHDAGCTSCIEIDTPKNDNAHKYETTYTAPTCTTAGSVVTVCKNGCGTTLTDITLSKLGHEWNDGVVTTKATCTTDGVKTFTCTHCSATRTEVIAKTGHNWSAGEAHDADCTHGAYTSYTCSKCDATYDAVQNGAQALGHSWNDGEVTTEPTCTADGVKTFTCTREGCKVTRTEVIAKLGHNFIAGTTHPATCTSGEYTEYRCANCGESYNSYNTASPATGHSWGEWTVNTQATNDADGEMSRTCSKCGETETVTIPKGSHTFSTTPTEEIPATCHSEGQQIFKCTAHEDCGVEITVTTAKIAHTLNTVVVPATCTTPGSVTTSCTVDGCDFEPIVTVIPAIGHELDDGTHHAADCTHSGYTTYNCKNCDYTTNVIDLTSKVGHDWEKVDGSSTATCDQAGFETYECTKCHSNIQVSVAALGHDFSVLQSEVASTCNSVGHKIYKCSRCDQTTTVYESTLADHRWNEWQTVQTATSVLPGIKIRQCSVCGKYEYEYTAPTGAHVYDEGKVTKPATCTEDGVKTYTCVGTDCDCTEGNRAGYTEIIPATGHDKVLEFKDATCTDSGYAKVVCNTCGATFENEVIAAKGHTYPETPAISEAPTCSKDGKLVYKCTVCHAEKVITIAKVASAHNWVADTDNSQSATCTQAEYKAYKCANCDADDNECTATYKQFVQNALPHTVDESKTVSVAATCKDAGYVKKYCSCGQLMETEIINPNDNHTWEAKTAAGSGCLKSGYTYEECSVCGAIRNISVSDAADHEYEQRTAKEATCTANGKIEIYCTTCKEVVKTIDVPALGHDFGGTPETIKPTCQTGGSVTFTCQRDGCDATLEKTLEKIPHDYQYDKSVAATCTNSAYDLYKCANCGATYTKITGNAADHTFVADAEHPDVAATCTTAGHVYRKCSECGKTYDYVVPATGHSYTGEVTQNKTCTKPEITTYTCSACGDSYTVITAVPTGEHSWSEWEVTTPATSTTAGEEKRTCSVCGLVETAPIPATGNHIMEEVTGEYVAPTCTTAGKRVFRCTVHEDCSANYNIELAPLGHQAKLEHQDATCNRAGYSKIVCTRDGCGLTLEETTIPALKHSYVEVGTRVEPTCKDNGTIYYECENCGATTTSSIAATGAHKLVVKETVAATCTTQGYTLYECAYGCGYTCKNDLTGLADHTIARSEVTVEPTCTGSGYKTNYCECGAVVSVETVDPTGHTWEAKTAAGSGCLESGYTYEECSVCGAIRNISVSDAADHTYEQRVQAATCTENGQIEIYCKTCGKVAETIDVPALGHDFGGTPETVKPTCQTEGSVTYTCQRDGCDEKLVQTIDKVPHNYQKSGEAVPATCTHSGYQNYKCADCDASYNEILENATDHIYGDDPDNANVAATCCTEGHVYKKCANCDARYDYVVPATGEHVYDSGTVVIEAGCLNSEVTEYRCTTDGCDASYREVTAPATGHNYTSWTYIHSVAIGTCGNCDETTAGHTITVANVPVEAGHSWVFDRIVTEATCNSQGTIVFKCGDESCTATLTKQYGPVADSHVWDDGVVTTEPTCTEDGVKTYTCSECGAARTEAVAKLGHEYTQFVETVEATCVADGHTTYKCQRCGDTKTEIIAKNADNHKFETVITAPTCTEDGYTTEICKLCGYEGTKTVNSGTALGHSEEIVTTEPTCTEAGMRITRCTRCSTVIKTEGIAPLGHSYETTPIKAATCTENGENELTCTRCGDTKTETVPATGHAYKEKTRVEATCVENGYIEYVCENDSTHTYKELIQAPGHDLTEIETVAPTCTEMGYTLYHCSRCDEDVKDNYVDALGHDWDDGVVTVEGSCTEQRVTEYTCKRCGEKRYEYTGTPEAHDYQLTSIVAPTCTQPGYDLYVCTRCGKEEKRNVVPMLGHDWGDWIITKYPTETESGWQEHVCQRCGETEKQEIIDGDFYLVTFYNYDGTRLMPPAYYQTGAKARRPKTDPVRAADVGYTYTFKGWNFSDSEIDSVTKRMAIIAQYDANERLYTVIYQSDSGDQLATVQNVPFSQINSSYPNEAPTKASDELNDYEFASWSITCDTEKGTAVATATFKAIEKSPGKQPSGKPGIFTRFIEWLKNLFKKLFGR